LKDQLKKAEERGRAKRENIEKKHKNSYIKPKIKKADYYNSIDVDDKNKFNSSPLTNVSPKVPRLVLENLKLELNEDNSGDEVIIDYDSSIDEDNSKTSKSDYQSEVENNENINDSNIIEESFDFTTTERTCGNESENNTSNNDSTLLSEESYLNLSSNSIQFQSSLIPSSNSSFSAFESKYQKSNDNQNKNSQEFPTNNRISMQQPKKQFAPLLSLLQKNNT
jgi:hypothetical protein